MMRGSVDPGPGRVIRWRRRRPRLDVTSIIEVANLHKRYGATVAVDDVSFAVDEGEIFGILGPNGAGKTTTVECLTGRRVRGVGGAMEIESAPGEGTAISVRVPAIPMTAP